MCVDPATISILATVASVIGTGVSGVASYGAAKARQQQAENNAIIAQRNANDSRARGVVAQQKQQLQTRQMIGKQINVLSERSIDLAGGTALDIIGDTAMFGKLDELTTKQNFEREAIAYEAQSMNFLAAAGQEKNTATAAVFGTGASLFSTALGGVNDYRKAKALSGQMSL